MKVRDVVEAERSEFSDSTVGLIHYARLKSDILVVLLRVRSFGEDIDKTHIVYRLVTCVGDRMIMLRAVGIKKCLGL